MSSLLNTAITGIRLNQTALAVTGHNIVNANTEGYSRQSVVQSTNPALRTAAGYLGAGVRVDTIARNSEKYLVDQVLRDIGSLSEADAYLVNVSQVNNLLAADKTNLANYMNQYFDAMNQAINDPGSLLGRELLLTQSQELAAGFRAMNARLQSQNDAINKQLQGAADNISSIARQIADINTSIADAQGTGGAPNDLLDKLDMLVTELGRYVATTTVPRDQGGLDVFIGQGQPLVVGNTVQTLKAVPGRIDASRYELVFDSKSGIQDVTRLMSGGEIGGLLRFRQDALTPAIASLGLLATVLAGSINEQNRQGMDLEGSLGGDVFRGINDPSVAAARVKSNAGNMLPNDRVLNVTIDNFADLKASDYELRFPGPGRQYVLTRLSDNTAVASGLLPQELPQSISVDGFSINLEAGSFQQGDRFLIQPVSTAINQFDVKITRAEEFAFASPLNVSSSPANQGGASVQGVQVLDVNANIFNQQAQLDPPLLVRFTSSTTYDVLDNSNPARPVPLQPPLANLSFVPGASNALLPSDPGGRTVVSAGPAAGALSLSADNGYPGEVISIQRTDPVTGFISETNVTLAAGESAADAARRLNNVDGVRATAFTETSLSGFADGGGNAILDLTLNGISLTDPDWIRPGNDAPETVPQPLTADYLRDRINSEPALRDQGIEAISDGVNVRVVSRQGVDLGFVVGGTGSLDMTANGATQSVATAAPGDPVTEVTVGGKLQVLLAADTELTTSSTLGLFGDNPQHLENFLGFQMQLTSGTGAAGQPVAGDSFVINYNRDGSADNRNGLALLALNGSTLLGSGSQTYQDLYGQLTETVGILTSQARVTQSAGESMLRQSMDALQSLSGVNLEEEAARLIQLEQHYNASARLITLARDLFDTLLRM